MKNILTDGSIQNKLFGWVEFKALYFTWYESRNNVIKLAHGLKID
jgi:hypothetical protein